MAAAQPATSLLLVSGLSEFHCPGPPPSPDLTALLCGGNSLLALLTEAQAAALRDLLPVQHIHAAGLVCTPGLVDLHVHLAGGGGEAGPASRTPEAALSQLIQSGLTTVVGVTGTDSVMRSQENLVAKMQALREDLTALHWCGSYRLPPPTATGSVQRDLCLLPSCVGVGEVAVADHRGSAPTSQDLLRLGLEARVGGLLGGKAGLVHVHMGPGPEGLEPLRQALAQSFGQLPISTFHPTHMGRNAWLVQQGDSWLRDGGSLDVTAGSQEQALAALGSWRAEGAPMGRVTVSSDAYGSLPVFDKGGRLVGYDVAAPDSLLRLLRALVGQAGWPLAEALPLMTSNPAAVLKLPHKGRLAVGADADVLLLEPSSLEVRYVIAQGRVVKTPEWTLGGMFERGPGIRPKQPPTEAG